MGRWRRHLDPNIRKCSWLAREDDILKAKYNELGSQWSNISKHLAGRTAQQCRARWFQVCPPDGQDGAAPRGVAPIATHKRERHHDGPSIKASARQLLALMEKGAPKVAPKARGKRASKARPAPSVSETVHGEG